MTSRALAVPAIGLAALAAAVPASAGPKKPPITKTYEVTNPVPWPQGGTAPGNGCQDGQETASKNTAPFKIPAAGVFKIELKGFVGDWDLILFDDKGKLLAESATDNGTTNTGTSNEKITFKKGKPNQNLRVVACNWAGGPKGTVSWVFTYN